MRSLFFIFTLFVFGCNNSKDKSDDGRCLTKYPADSADYRLIKCGLYIGKDGDLYEEKVQVDKFNSPYCYSVFYDKYVNRHYADSVVQIPLKSIIDIDSYVCFDSSSYSKDKNKCYYYYENTDGGFRFSIDGADPATFKNLTHHYLAADKNFVYYRGEIIKGLNIEKYEVLSVLNWPTYFKDDKHIYYETDSIPGADAASFKLTPDKDYDAEDKNHKYKYGKFI